MIFAQTRRFRRTAAQMLLLWVFALAVGGVNTCVVAMTRMDAAASDGPPVVAAGADTPAVAASADTPAAAAATARGTPAAADDVVPAAAAHGEMVVVAHAPLAALGDDGAAFDNNAACAKSCGDRSHTVAAVKQTAQPSPDFALVVQPFERVVDGAGAALLAGRRVLAAPLLPAAPIPIVLRRLAL